MLKYFEARHADDDGTTGARMVFSRWQRVALLAAFALLVMLRIPKAWVHGRFLDEEVTVFFAYAWHYPWLDALLRPFAGYLNLGANATTLLVARLVRSGVVTLEHAPYFTMAMALAVQMLPAVLLLTGRAKWLEKRSTVVACLLFLAVAPGIEEVFFNVLHIQFHLALCVALIIALDPPSRAFARIGYAAILFLAPLCGPGVLAFSPILALRTVVDRDRRRFEQIAALALGGIVQLLFFFGPSPMRGQHVHAGIILDAILVRLAVMPTLGFGKAEVFGIAILHSKTTGGMLWLAWAAAVILALGLLLVTAARRKDATIWMLLSSATIAVASFGFGMVITTPYDVFNSDAERYNFLPLTLLCFALIVMATQSRSKARLPAILFLALTLITGVSRYSRPLPGLSQGPSWPAEVAAWRRDHDRPVGAWPKPWVADLSDHPHSCTPVGPEMRDSNDPRYCESGWVAGFYRAREAGRIDRDRQMRSK